MCDIFAQLARAKNIAWSEDRNYSSLVATTQRDKRFMRAALKEAKKAQGRTSPNPAVGAVLVVDNRLVAKGHHCGAGQDYAEIECLRIFVDDCHARASVYVSLVPG